MRSLTFMLACTFVLAGSSMAGSVQGSLPGIGTFAYGGPAIAVPAPSAMVVAVNEK